MDYKSVIEKVQPWLDVAKLILEFWLLLHLHR
jgi:hypothetical protein